MSNEIIKAKESALMQLFAGKSIEEQCKALAECSFVPKQFQGKPTDVAIAMEYAQRIGCSPVVVLQNLNIIGNKPSWSSKFLIQIFNSCGRFEPIRYRFSDDRTQCCAYTAYKGDTEYKEKIVGPIVSLEMAKAEGWLTKPGSKWRTMPDLMLRYRAAAFLVRTEAPELELGYTTEEQNDMEKNYRDFKNETANNPYKEE